MKVFEEIGYITDEHVEFAKQNGIGEQVLKQRYYYKGWSLQEALTTPYGKKRQTEWSRWRDIALQNGICQGTYMSRLERGWDYWLAATKKAHKQPEWSRWRDIALQNGINVNTYSRRVYNGWRYKDAATKPARKKKGATA